MYINPENCYVCLPFTFILVWKCQDGDVICQWSHDPTHL